MRPLSQEKQILAWMQKGKTITTYQAYDKFGCTRLGAVIYALKKKGYDIDDVFIKVSKDKHVKKYWMVK